MLYLASRFRWWFHGQTDVAMGVSLAAIGVFLALCLAAVWWIFRTGWRIKQ